MSLLFAFRKAETLQTVAKEKEKEGGGRAGVTAINRGVGERIPAAHLSRNLFKLSHYPLLMSLAKQDMMCYLWLVLSYNKHHIVLFTRVLLAILLLCSVTSSLTAGCPYMNRMEREMVQEKHSCCSTKPAQGHEEDQPVRSCCSHKGRFCTCIPPIPLLGVSGPNQTAPIEVLMPTPPMEEAIHCIPSEPPFPPPRG
jgi:hypothetical protein